MKDKDLSNSLTVWVNSKINIFDYFSDARASIFTLNNLSLRYFAVRIRRNKIVECTTIGSDPGDSYLIPYSELPETFRTQLLLLGVEHEVN